MQSLNIIATVALAVWGGSTAIVGGAYIGCFCSRRIQRIMLG